MHEVEIVYNEERGTWNLFVDNEWYFEGNYEQVEQMAEPFYFED